MNIEPAEREMLETLQPDAVQAYLRARGWEDVGTEGPSARVYAKPELGSASELLVPTKPSARDYGRLTGILVDRIAFVEQMARAAVIQDLSFAGYDVLRVRIVEADDGSLDLEKIVVVVKEARAALVAAAAATAAGVPRKNYTGRQHESVGAFVDRIRVGQTERGSFVVPLLSPYAFDPDDGLTFPGEWFARRVMKKLTVGLGTVDRVLGASNGATVDSFLDATPQGVSANLCGALGRLVQAVGDIELGVRWASAAPEKPVQTVKLARASASTLLRASSRLAEADPPPAEPFVGWITHLDNPRSVATAEAMVDGKLRNIRCYFDERMRADFATAWEQRRPLLLQGPIVREGKRLSVRQLAIAHPLDVEPDEDEGIF